MLAAAWPSAVQIWRVNAATEVFPLVPVTAAITRGWCEKNFAAASAKALRASSTLMNATPAGSGVGGGRCAIIAAAPAARACGMKLSPSVFAPAMATKRSPAFTARLSALTPAISSAAKRASLRASAVRSSASFMAWRIVYPRCRASSRDSNEPISEFRSGLSLPAARARQDQLIGRRQVEARLEAEQGRNAADDGAANGYGVPSRGGEAMRVGGRLRLIEHDEEKVARLVGRQHRGERGEHLGLGIAAADHFVRSSGLAADVVTLHVRFGGGALLDVQTHEIAHLFAGLGLDHLGRERKRVGFAALEEGRRNEASAVHQRADCRHRLQRRYRQPVAERDGHSVEFGPALGYERLGAFGQLGAQPLELAHLPQEPFVMLDSEAQRHARGADVGRIGEDLRNREHAVLSVEIVDGEFPILQRTAGIERRFERDLTGVERHRDGERLEGRAHLEHTGGEAVDASRIEGLAWIVGVVVRHRHQRDDLTGAHISQEARSRYGLELGAGGDQLVAQRVLHPQVDGKLDWLLQAVGGESREMQIGKPARVEPFLDAGGALIVDVDVADEMRDLGSVRIDALVLGQEADPGNTKPVNLLALLRRDLALEPDEAALGRKPPAQLGGVDLRHHRGEQLRCLVHVDNPVRLGEQRWRAPSRTGLSTWTRHRSCSPR